MAGQQTKLSQVVRWDVTVEGNAIVNKTIQAFDICVGGGDEVHNDRRIGRLFLNCIEILQIDNEKLRAINTWKTRAKHLVAGFQSSRLMQRAHRRT